MNQTTLCGFLRRSITLCTILISACMIGSANSQIDLGKLAGALGGGSASDAGDLLGSVIGGVLSTDKVSLSQIQGKWSYSSPAISFKSDNLLKKAGGAAAAAKISEKIEPVYKLAGVQNMTITINADSTFTISSGRINLSGTISPATKSNSAANFVFNFNAMGKFKALSLDVYMVRGVSDLQLMFDVSRLLDVVRRVGNISGENGTIGSLVKLLGSYDGMCAGFDLTKSR